MAGGRYAAFISYSNAADEQLAAWLQRALETYRVPETLIGRDGLNGPVAARLGAIFPHRTESSELTPSARDALDRSDALIVVRTPRGAQRDDAAEEYFKSLGRGGRILTAVVEGEQTAAPETFVWRKMVDEGQPAPEDASALLRDFDGPMCADFRGGKDERNAAKLKIVAALTGLGAEELLHPPKPVPPPKPVTPVVPPKQAAPPKPPRPAPPPKPAREPRPATDATPSAAPAPPNPRLAAMIAAGIVVLGASIGGVAWISSREPAGDAAQSLVAEAVPPATPLVTQSPAVEITPGDALFMDQPEILTPPLPAELEATIVPSRATAGVEPPPSPQREPATAAAPPPPAPTPTITAANDPPPIAAQLAAARSTENVSVATLLPLLRQLGGEQSIAVRCLGRANQISRTRARQLIASGGEAHQAELIAAFNEGYMTAENRDDPCPAGAASE